MAQRPRQLAVCWHPVQQPRDDLEDDVETERSTSCPAIAALEERQDEDPRPSPSAGPTPEDAGGLESEAVAVDASSRWTPILPAAAIARGHRPPALTLRPPGSPLSPMSPKSTWSAGSPSPNPCHESPILSRALRGAPQLRRTHLLQAAEESVSASMVCPHLNSEATETFQDALAHLGAMHNQEVDALRTEVNFLKHQLMHDRNDVCGTAPMPLQVISEAHDVDNELESNDDDAVEVHPRGSTMAEMHKAALLRGSRGGMVTGSSEDLNGRISIFSQQTDGRVSPQVSPQALFFQQDRGSKLTRSNASFFSTKNSRILRRMDSGSSEMEGVSSSHSVRRRKAKISVPFVKEPRVLAHMQDAMEIVVAVTIFANGIVIGVQTDLMARELSQSVPVIFTTCEGIFCAIFTTELAIRLANQRLSFFRDSEVWRWNVFDMILVALQWIEIFGIFFSDTVETNVTFLRLLRLLRLLRVFRLLRLLHYFGELAVVMSAIAASMKSLIGTLVLLLMLVYVGGITFTQIVLTHRLDMNLKGIVESDDLAFWWGDLRRSILSLFESVLSGVEWGEPLSPLFDISALVGLLFVAYVVFALLAMMNVVTGIFVQSALEHANAKKSSSLSDHVGTLFDKLELEGGKISFPEYIAVMDDPLVREHLMQSGIEPSDAKGLFRFISRGDHEETVDAQELLETFVRLGCSARIMDIMSLKYRIERLQQDLGNFSLFVQKSFSRNFKADGRREGGGARLRGGCGIGSSASVDARGG